MRVTGFCERARQCGMAKALAKPSACFQLRWARVSLNAGMAQVLLFLPCRKGLEEGRRKWKRHLLCQGRRPQMLGCKDLSSSPSDQSMKAELGLLARRASHSPIQALNQITLLLDHWAFWMRFFVPIVLIGHDRSWHVFDHACLARKSIRLERPPWDHCVRFSMTEFARQISTSSVIMPLCVETFCQDHSLRIWKSPSSV